MQPTTEIVGDGSGGGGGPMYPASIKQASVTHVASVTPKIEEGDKSSYGLLLVRPLTLGRLGSWDGQLAQLPHIRRWIKGDLVEEETRSLSTLPASQHIPVLCLGKADFVSQHSCCGGCLGSCADRVDVEFSKMSVITT
ncbi:hypothetical protein J4Q44_G00095760 [Coregonus suidteri]|uniref:Uncharacterized protein n=1 Tax=Coregonus suidteri TaxID=861788 RepID=A0AAN8M2E6_9TELE